MPALRILRIPIARIFAGRGASTPVLPLTARQASSRARSPPSLRGAGRLSSRRAYSTSPSPPPSPSSSSSSSTPKPTSLSGRLKQLIKTHGWYALGVYLSLSVLDYSLTFAGIYLLGADKVILVTDRIKHQMTESIGWPPAPVPPNSAYDMDEGTVAAPNAANSMYAIAILAYGIHKTLWMPFRVGLTAAITPRFVAFLTRRGWVGKGGFRRASAHLKDKVQQPNQA